MLAMQALVLDIKIRVNVEEEGDKIVLIDKLRTQ